MIEDWNKEGEEGGTEGGRGRGGGERGKGDGREGQVRVEKYLYLNQYFKSLCLSVGRAVGPSGITSLFFKTFG